MRSGGLYQQEKHCSFAMRISLLSVALPSLASGLAHLERLGIARTCPPKHSVLNIELFSFAKEEEEQPMVSMLSDGEHCSLIPSIMGHGLGTSCQERPQQNDVGELCLREGCRYELWLMTSNNNTDTLTPTNNNDCSLVDSVVKIKVDQNVVWETTLQSVDLDAVFMISVGSNQTTMETSGSKWPQTVGDQHRHLSVRPVARQAMVARRFLQVSSVRIHAFSTAKLHGTI